MRARGLAVLFAALMVAPAAAAAASAHSTSKPSKKLVTASGAIRQLGLARISVGHITCSIPKSLVENAGRFVIGDPVALTCRAGKLLEVKYRPEQAPAASSKLGSVPSVAPITSFPTSATSTSGAGGVSTGLCTNTVEMFGSTLASTSSCNSSPTTLFANGSISAADNAGVTVDGLSCSLPAGLSSPQGSQAFQVSSSFHVGGQASLSCYANGQLAKLTTLTS